MKSIVFLICHALCTLFNLYSFILFNELCVFMVFVYIMKLIWAGWAGVVWRGGMSRRVPACLSEKLLQSLSFSFLTASRGSNICCTFHASQSVCLDIV
jgi:hypothetical protein